MAAKAQQHQWTHNTYGWSTCVHCNLKRWQGPHSRYYVNLKGENLYGHPPRCKRKSPPEDRQEPF